MGVGEVGDLTRAEEDMLAFGKVDRPEVRAKICIAETQEITDWPYRAELWSGRAMVPPSTLQAGMSQRKEKRMAFYLIRL